MIFTIFWLFRALSESQQALRDISSESQVKRDEVITNLLLCDFFPLLSFDPSCTAHNLSFETRVFLLEVCFAVCVIFKCDLQSLTKSEIREETEEEVSQVVADEESSKDAELPSASIEAAKIEVVSNFTQTDEDLKPPTPPPIEKVETPPPDLEARETQVLCKKSFTYHLVVLDV